MITTEQKVSIVTKLQEYCETKGSQNKAANSLKKVSAATISQMINSNWELITDEMWRSVSAQIGWKNSSWTVVQTRDFKLINRLLKDAQTEANVFGVIGAEGSGKTQAIKSYTQTHKNVFNLQCSEYWNKKQFLYELLGAMGTDGGGLNVATMMSQVVHGLKKMPNPIIIIDEADKLKDEVFYFFITLYNYLEDHCGIVIFGTDHLQKRIHRGIKLNKKGYKEIYSRLGKKFVVLLGVGSTDVHQVCVANGVTDAKKIKTIFDDCKFDLRRVKRLVHTIKMTSTN